MKKKVIGCILAAAMVTEMFAGCGDASSGSGGGEGSSSASAAASSSSSAPTQSESATGASVTAVSDGAEAVSSGSGSNGTSSYHTSGKTYAIVTKSAGNPYNEKEASGFQEEIEKAGGTAVVVHPDAATADAQISVVQSLISQKVDTICIAANDENALQASLQQAMNAGIKVSCLDSKVNPESRATFVNQAGTDEIGQHIVRVGCADQLTNRKSHALRQIAGQNIAKIAGGNSEIHCFTQRDAAGQQKILICFIIIYYLRS